MYRRISYFNGLNALRFFAALLVILHHGETARKKIDPEWNFSWLSLFRNGGIAVEFFFVLSGFLITYLLLKEWDERGRIHIRQFYLKRVLRIWPLYFIVIFLATSALPSILSLVDIGFNLPYKLTDVWYYFILFLPGLVTFYYGAHILEPTWSIGVEEVFYLFWAPLFARFRAHLPAILWSIIGIKLVLFLWFVHGQEDGLAGYIVRIHRFEDMAVGGLGAWYLFHRARPLSESWLFRKPVQGLLYMGLVVFLVFYKNIDWGWWSWLFTLPLLVPLILDSLFLYLILGVALAENSIIRLRSPVLHTLGEISYGIYMYHLVVIFLVIRFFKPFLQGLSPIIGMVGYYTMVITLSIGIAYLSKTYIENYFLRLKSRLL